MYNVKCKTCIENGKRVCCTSNPEILHKRTILLFKSLDTVCGFNDALFRGKMLHPPVGVQDHTLCAK